MLGEALKRIRLTEKFYQSYGKDIKSIELSLIIIIVVFYEIVNHFFPPPSFVFYSCITILIIAGFTHGLFYQELGNRELYPESLLFLDKFHRYFVAFLITIFFSLFFISLSVAVYFPTWIKINSDFSLYIEYLLNIILPLLIASAIFVIGSLSRFKKARISVKLALIKATNIKHIQDESEKKRTTGCLVGLFNEGLNAYNDYLNHAMLHVCIKDLEEYNKAICFEFLAGKDEEQIAITNQILLFLNSLHKVEHKEDLRDSLTALKNIRTGKDEDEYPISELMPMITVVKPIDAFKSAAQSPYFIASLAIIAIIVQIVAH